MKRIAGVFMIVIAIVLLGYAANKYLPRLLDYKASRDLYNDLNDKYTSDPDENDNKTEDEQKTSTKNGKASVGNGTDEKQESDAVIQDLAQIVPGDPNEFMYIETNWEELLNLNPDYSGWIYIPKTGISYPVVYSSDNADYLHTNFNKEYSFAGTIFMDYRCTKGVLNHHTVLYGHNMRDGSMFAELNDYKDQKFADEHPVFWFITPEYAFLYRIFSVCSPNPYDRTQYGIDLVDYKDNDEFEQAIEAMIDNSVVQTGTKASGRDYIMSLSTCTGISSVRCLVHGKMLGGVKYKPSTS